MRHSSATWSIEKNPVKIASTWSGSAKTGNLKRAGYLSILSCLVNIRSLFQGDSIRSIVHAGTQHWKDRGNRVDENQERPCDGAASLVPLSFQRERSYTPPPHSFKAGSNMIRKHEGINKES
jgi:hypothetical protein